MAALRLTVVALLSVASTIRAVPNLPNVVTTGEADFSLVADSSNVAVGGFTPIPSAHSVDLNKIFRPNMAGASANLDRTSTYRNQPEASPASARVINLFYNPGIAGTPGAAGNAIQNAHIPQHNRLKLVYGDGNTAPLGNLDVKLEAPYLEIDPASCGNGLDCRCNPNQAAEQTGQIIQPYLIDPTLNGAAGAQANDADARKVILNQPRNPVLVPPLNPLVTTVVADMNAFTSTYFEHAPWAGQDPYMRTHRRLCVRTNGDVNPFAWRDTGILVAVTQACSSGSNGQAFADAAANSDCSAKVRDDLNIRGADANMGKAGATITQTPSLQAYLGDFYTASLLNNNLLVPKTYGDGVVEGETNAMFLERHSRTVCCGANNAALAFAAPGPRTVTTPDNGQRYGVCISSNTVEANCCGRRPYNPKEEKCCNRLGSLVENLDATCPCTLGSRTDNPSRAVGMAGDFRAIDNVCDRNAANVFAVGDFAGLSNAAVASGTCADITKNGVDLTDVVRHSHCTGDGLVACDDGNLYDPATHQCCLINGVQTLDFPCPCSLDTHCSGASRCCFQAWPLAVEDEGTCSPFANFPIVIDGAQQTELSTGPAPTALQQCRGSCYDPTYQTCCNGNLCEREYERCCNTTCCNTFTSSCTQGLQGSGSVRPGSNSARNYGVYFEVCTEIENLTGMRAFFVFVLPAVLLFATLLSLALVAVVARRATEHIFELTERALVVVAVIVVLLATAFFFSPLWKWGLVIALLGLAAIVIAVARRMDASLVLVILALAVLLYVVNPWAGNNYIGATSNVVSNGVWSQSLFEAARNLWYSAPDSREGPALNSNGMNECTSFYDYFKYDANVHDFGRHDNGMMRTFGYCSRSWITALMVIAAILTFLLVLLLLLAIFSYLKKLGYKPVEPVQLELTYDQPQAQFYPEQSPLLAAGGFANPVF